MSDLPKIGSPATNALANRGITKLQEVTTMTEKELLGMHGVGPKAVRILKEELKNQGLELRK